MMHWNSCLYCMFYYSLWVAVLSLLSGGGAASHSSPPLGFTLGFLTLVGDLQLDQMSFDPLPSLPRIPLLELCWESSPGCLSESCSVSIFCYHQSVFYKAPLLKVMYKQARISKQTHRSTHASQMPVGLVPVDNP